MKKSAKIAREISYPQIIALGFFLLISIGTILLSLPAASRDGNSAGLINAAFTATSASCVTGLVVYDTYLHWTPFGQAVIIALIQTGGLGFLTIIAFFSMLLRRRIGLKERSLLQESVNTMYIGGIIRLVKKILIGTAFFELSGAILLFLRFKDELETGTAICTSLFMSISAFCNAGFDLMGRYEPYSSLVHYYDDPVVNITICILILAGGTGFFVWDDISQNKFHFSRYKLHSKIALISTAALTVAGTALFWIFENDNLFKDMSVSEKFLASLFSSVTPRTAGFNTVDTAAMSPASTLLTIIYMFIGGSPGSTAGGAKTVTVFVIVLSLIASMRNSNSLNAFGRRLEEDSLKKACSVVTINMILAMTSAVIIFAVQPELGFSDVIFEVFSAIDTVGMTTGITRDLNNVSKVVIILLMFCGRVGSMSFALLFTENKTISTIQNPVEKINIG